MSEVSKPSMERSGRLQGWLQMREWAPAWWLGNRLSDVRYWTWRLLGGR